MKKRVWIGKKKRGGSRWGFVVTGLLVVLFCIGAAEGGWALICNNTDLSCKVYAEESSDQTNGAGVLGEDFDLSFFDDIKSGTEFTFTGRFWSTRNGKYGYLFIYKQEYGDGSFTAVDFCVKDKTDGDVLSSLKDVSYKDEISVVMKATYDKTEYYDQQEMIYVTVSEAAIVENTIDYADAYSAAADSMESEAAADGWDASYSLCDLDNDGIYEMIFQWGSNANFYNHVWTIDSAGVACYVGYFYNAQSFYVAPDYNGIFGVYGHMGYEIVTRISLKDGVIVEETINEGDIGENDYFSNGMPVYSYELSDWSTSIGEAAAVLEEYDVSNESSDDSTAESFGTEIVVVLEEDSSEIDWDSLSDEEWYEEVQAYWYEKTEDSLGGTWEWIEEKDVSDEMYEEIIEFISDYIDYDTYLNDYYGGDEEFARSRFISIYNDIKYIEAAYYIQPGSAAVFLIDYCDYSIQDVRNMTWYNILSQYEEIELEIWASWEEDSEEYIETINGENYAEWFRSAPETGSEIRIEGLTVSTVFASDGQLLCYLWNDSEYVNYYLYILTDDAGRYLNGDSLTVTGIYLGKDSDNNRPGFRAETIELNN